MGTPARCLLLVVWALVVLTTVCGAKRIRPVPRLPEEGRAMAMAVFNGFIADKLELKTAFVKKMQPKWDGGEGCVLHLNASLKKHDPVLKIARQHTLCDHVLIIKPYGDELLEDRNRKVIAVRERLALALAIEYMQADTSIIWQWIRALPRLHTSELYPPWAWQEQDIAAIEPRSVQRSVRQVLAHVEAKWRFVKKRMRLIKSVRKLLTNFLKYALAKSDAAHDAQLKQSNDEDEDVSDPTRIDDGGAIASNPDDVDFKRTTITKELFMWGWAITDTRAWTLDNTKYLVPGADFVNYRPDEEDKTFTPADDVVPVEGTTAAEKPRENIPENEGSEGWRPDHRYLKWEVFHFNNSGELILFADRDVNADEAVDAGALQLAGMPPKDHPGVPVFEAYGDHPEAFFFVRHGFTTGAPELYATAYMDDVLSEKEWKRWRRAADLRFPTQAAAAAAWSALTDGRNRRDYHPLPLSLMGWWHPTASEVASGAAPPMDPPSSFAEAFKAKLAVRHSEPSDADHKREAAERKRAEEAKEEAERLEQQRFNDHVRREREAAARGKTIEPFQHRHDDVREAQGRADLVPKNEFDLNETNFEALFEEDLEADGNRPPAPEDSADAATRLEFLKAVTLPRTARAFFGDIHPLLIFKHLVTVLPAAVLKAERCQKAVGLVEATKRTMRRVRHRVLWTFALEHLVACVKADDTVRTVGGHLDAAEAERMAFADKVRAEVAAAAKSKARALNATSSPANTTTNNETVAPSDAGNSAEKNDTAVDPTAVEFVPGFEKYRLAALRSLHVSVAAVFRAEFASTSVDDDVRGMSPRALREFVPPRLHAVRQRLRMRLQRKLIFKELLRRVAEEIAAIEELSAVLSNDDL